MSESWMPQSPIITAAELPHIFTQHPLIAVHVWAVWNRHDRRMDATIQNVRREFDPRINFYALDMDNEANWDFLKQERVLSIPLVLCFVNGKQTDRVAGSVSEDVLRDCLKKWLA